MAYVDADGLVVPEPDKGDVLRIVYVLRAKDYGPLSVPAPLLISHHHTARWMPDGELGVGAVGMLEMGARIRKRNEYTQLYVGRDGVAVQCVRYGRACVGTEGSVQVGEKRRETNRIAFQIEWDSWGVASLKGGRGRGAPIINPKRQDAVRVSDPLTGGKVLAQPVPARQARAIAEICAAVVRKSGMRPIDALHGHRELGRGSHPDPNTFIIEALEKVVAPALGLGRVTAPARNVSGDRTVIRPGVA
jgi:hypothetical protein